MLIFERFVFIHMPKTAGTFLRQALVEELSPPVSDLRSHAGWDDRPREARSLPVLTYVRNPWDWYVSWYAFMTRRWLPYQQPEWFERNPWARTLFGSSNDFATMVHNACRSSRPLDPRLTDDDFYTAGFKLLVGSGLGSDQLTVGRFESAIDDLETFLDRHEIPHDEDLMRRVRARRPVNSTEHRPYREYYPDDLRDLVRDSCRIFVDDFGYRF